MKKVMINLRKELDKILPTDLVKDLQDNERICPTCNGLGMTTRDNIFGLKGDISPEALNKMFPYKNQSLTFCPDCYNGTQALCEYCEKPIEKGWISKCDCEEYLKIELEKTRKDYSNSIDKVQQVDEKDVKTYLYSEVLDKYFSESYEFVEYWESEYEQDNPIPKILWVCEEVKLSLDAHSILEGACEELHDDSFDNCDISQLQSLLDEYAKDQDGTLTYYPSYKQYIVIEKEK